VAVGISSPLDQLDRSSAAVAGLISSIRPEQWAAPTPCTDWTVRELVGHLVGMNRVFSYPGPLGAATGAERLQRRLYDLLAHGWDLAQATGQPVRLPDDAAEQALAFARVQIVDSARPGRFGPAEVVSPQAPAIDRLVAFLGRRVGLTESTTADRVVTFAAADGTRLAGHRTGDGRPLVCIPGGPMRAAAYLGDLGGLVRRHPTVLLDLRGTGESAVPTDPTSYRCDRQVEDVQALRRHLGLDQVDLAGHSAGAAVAIRYAARHPERVSRLLLITPSPRPVGLEISDADRRQVADLRRGEPWFPAAYAAFERIWAGDAADADWDGITPFTYGRWDAIAATQHARQAEEQNADAADRYYAAGAVDVAAVRSALGRLRVPVLLLAGEYDIALPPPRARQYATLFPDAEVVVQPRAGHYPWLDDPVRFADTALRFLGA
jgi:pimeloyl-ACP methyl ester carboxylesterase